MAQLDWTAFVVGAAAAAQAAAAAPLGDSSSGGAPTPTTSDDFCSGGGGDDAADAAATAPAAPAVSLDQVLHESVLERLLLLLDARSKCSLLCTCRTLKRMLATREEHWRRLVFDTAGEQHGLGAQSLFSMLARSHGTCEVIRLARCEEAREAEGHARFSNGFKCDQALPHTRGLRAYALAAMLPNLRHLSIDERASCVGGMTNDLARALAVHCKRLAVLEVFFERYSMPSELFTDEGLIALSEGCGGALERLTLHNCDRVSDRALYAVAANCGRTLAALALGGYNEHVTDGGVTVLLEACPGLRSVRLSGKLLKVGDASGAALAAHCPGLTHAKLTCAMTDATVRALAARCPALVELDAHRCRAVGGDALRALLDGCPALARLLLPLPPPPRGQQRREEGQEGGSGGGAAAAAVALLAARLPRCSVREVDGGQALEVLAGAGGGGGAQQLQH